MGISLLGKGEGGLGGREENRPETLFFFHGERHDNKILKVQILLSRNFVLIAQAPSFKKCSSLSLCEVMAGPALAGL